MKLTSPFPQSTSSLLHCPKRLSSYALCFMFLLQGCSWAIPEGIQPVANFDVTRYMGKWYEIARLDNYLERGLANVTETYSPKENGDIHVETIGWDTKKNKEKIFISKLQFFSDRRVGYLKAIFSPFVYGSYVLFYLEPDYSVALICSYSKDYLWIMARDPVLEEEVLAKYLAIAKEKGFAVEKLVYPQQVVTALNPSIK